MCAYTPVLYGYSGISRKFDKYESPWVGSGRVMERIITGIFGSSESIEAGISIFRTISVKNLGTNTTPRQESLTEAL